MTAKRGGGRWFNLTVSCTPEVSDDEVFERASNQSIFKIKVVVVVMVVLSVASVGDVCLTVLNK